MSTLTLSELPRGTSDLYVIVEDGTDTGIGTPDELRQLVDEGVVSKSASFRLEWTA